MGGDLRDCRPEQGRRRHPPGAAGGLGPAPGRLHCCSYFQHSTKLVTLIHLATGEVTDTPKVFKLQRQLQPQPQQKLWLHIDIFCLIHS